MKSLLLALLFPFLMSMPVDDNVKDDADVARDPHPTFDKENCTCKGIPLHGRVKVIDSVWADFDVEISESTWVDLKVKEVTAFASNCGEWQFVEQFPDFTI